MRRAQRAELAGGILDEYFPNPPIPLIHKDAYTLLVAVLLSAQSRDERVNKITPSLFKLADTPSAMAGINPKIIEDIIRPCGLAPSKAQAISKLSRILVDKHHEQVPKDMQALEELPGVGHKTASVVLAQAFGVATFPVDTHIHRLACRWKLSNGKSVGQTEKDLKACYPSELWAKRHLQFIYFGRAYCPARGHSPSECPICSVLNPTGQ